MERAGLAVPTLVAETEAVEETVEETVEEVVEETAEEGVEEEVHTEEVDEGEMVSDEGTTSNEIKEFMEAHCSVDELGQIYEYLQEMMKRVSEEQKTNSRDLSKLAKRMARK